MTLVGDHLRAARIGKGWSQHEVADSVGLSTSYVSEIERGSRKPPIATVRKLARLFRDTVESWVWLAIEDETGADLAASLKYHAYRERRDPELAAERLEDPDYDDVECVGHEYQRRGSWDGDDWCVVEGCTSRGYAARSEA